MIKANNFRAYVEKRFRAFLDEVEKKEIARLQKLGEKCVNHARNVAPKPDGFEDQTGNLRSSIGYMVFNNGVAVHAGFEQVKGGAEGSKKGEELARKVGEKKNGICLVVTAGMDYAVYVEGGYTYKRKKKDGTEVEVHMKSRDVITSAEKMAERELPEELAKLVANIKRAAE